MTIRITLTLLLLLMILQGQLWLGRGSLPKVWELEAQLAQQREVNSVAELKISRVRAEIADLREGQVMLEERARFGLGMLKPNELFVQINR